MNAEKFIAHNYLWLAALAILPAISCIIAIKNYTTAKSQLKQKRVENKGLMLQVEEFQSDQNTALEHLTAAKDRKMKGLRIAHAKWREDTREKNAKNIEDLKAQHAAELALIKQQLQEIKDIKWANAAALAEMDKKHRVATESSLTAIEERHQVAMQERHYQFESKRVLYANFFKLLDQYRVDCHLRLQSAHPILNDFQRNFLKAFNYGNKQKSDAAIFVANKRLEKLWMDAQIALAKLKEEMNTIKFIASESAAQNIDEMSELYDDYVDIFRALLMGFIPNIMAKTCHKTGDSERSLKAKEEAVDAVREDFLNLIKEEIEEA